MNVPHPFGHGTRFVFRLFRAFDEIDVAVGATCVSTFTTSNGVTTMDVTTAPIVPDIMRVDMEDFFGVP